MSGLIPAWSYSRLKTFETCPYQLWLKAGEKRSTAHMDSKAADRGTMIHTACEKFVDGTGDFIKEMAKFADYFKDLKVKYEAGTVILEEDWGFDKDWQPTGYFDDNIWCRMKLDNLIWMNEDKTRVKATDYKSGKKFGNEVAHNQQGQIYVLGSFLRYPEVEMVDIEFVYLDHGITSSPKSYTREKAMKFLKPWTDRANALTDATEFKPKPNKINCKWCPFGPQNGDSSCAWGVDG